MRYKVGDKVRIKSIDWYNENKDEDGIVELSTHVFAPGMSQFCGKTLTINSVDNFDKKYKMTEDGCYFDWTDEMIEGLVEEETKPKFKVGDKVRIKSLDWYNNNSNSWGAVCFSDTPSFTSLMKQYCGKVMTIAEITNGMYRMKEDNSVFDWTDEMIEGLVEEETKPKFKVGDRIKWYNHTCNITSIDTNENTYTYLIKHNDYREDKTFAKWVPESELTFEDDEETKPKNEDEKNGESKPKYEDEVDGEYYSTTKYLVRPSGYQFVDENGNVINAMKIVLEKLVVLKFKKGDKIKDKNNRIWYVVQVGNRHFDISSIPNGSGFFVPIEDQDEYELCPDKELPKTYQECCKELNIAVRDLDILDNMLDTTEIIYSKNLDRLLNSFRKLLICRDAYWKIAGEEMGLGKSWEPDLLDDNQPKFVLANWDGNIEGRDYSTNKNYILTFPTPEMRDAFYENFKKEIEICKELL